MKKYYYLSCSNSCSKYLDNNNYIAIWYA